MKILYTHSKTLSGYLMAFAMVMFTYSVSAQTNHDVTIVGNSFSPATLTIDVGDQVTFINDAATGGGGFHNINGTQVTYPSNPDNTLDNGSAGNGPWSYVWTCTAAGLYDYQCDPHAAGGMVGTITAAAGGPANDLCANAEVITCGGTVTGSTVAATNTDELDNVPGAGVWYVFTGTGDVVTVSTDNAGTDYDTRIGYTDACGNAGIAFDEDGGTDFINGWTSVLTFASTIGTDYYIYVGGYQGTNTGAFEMTVTCTTPLANDLCTGAITIACGGTATGSTLAATATDASVCQPTGIGVWYQFVGTGDDVTISTDNAGTDFDTYLGVTESCGAVSCFVSDDDGGAGTTSVVEFASVLGQDYFIQVSSYNGTLFGNFEMTVTCTPPLCLADAGTLTADASPVCLVGGSADISATEADAPVVPAGYTTLYVLSQGAGLVLVDANTVPEFNVTAADDYTIHTLVYDPTVVDIASFPPGTTGFDVNALLIQGGGTICGALDVTGAPVTVDVCNVVPANDLCTDAETLVCGVATTGTTVGATDTDSPATCSAFANDLGVWYSFMGTGGNVQLSTCGPVTDGASERAFIAVYSGSCGALNCFYDLNTGNDPSCGTANSQFLDFLTDPGVMYYVFVTAGPGFPATIDFDLTLTCDPVTGITENGMEDINVYPNPSNGQFVLEVNGVDADAQITVMDVTGRQVYTEGVSMNGNFRKELNLNVAKGTYLLQIATVEGTVTRKIQIN